MHTKADPPRLPEGERPASAILSAYFEWNHLKQLYRQGWLRRGVPPARCESVAEHSFGVALLAMLLSEGHRPPLDPLKVLRMALVHDLGEAHAGDWTPHDGIAADRKHALESESVRRTLGPLPNGPQYLALWEEYARGESAEALFIRQVDRLEMALQAGVYEHQGLADLSEFFESVRPAMTAPELRSILQELEGLRASKE
jgi:putative hydrolases of HD superfamily